MNWKFWQKKETQTPVTTDSTAQESARVISFTQHPTVLKKLKWVVEESTGRVGIITNIDAGSMVNVDLVGEDGTTYMAIRTQIGNVRIARLQEIPANRRPTNPAYAATLGYF